VIDMDREYAAAIIVNRAGIPRLSRTLDGGPQEAWIDADKLNRELRAGDTVVGIVHNHPIPASETLHFSEGDVTTAQQFLRDNRAVI
jgi:hypothetical protein